MRIRRLLQGVRAFTWLLRGGRRQMGTGIRHLTDSWTLDSQEMLLPDWPHTTGRVLKTEQVSQ